MATYTSFLNLEKPSTSERLDVLKINSNWDKIDAGVSALNSQIAGTRLFQNPSRTMSGTIQTSANITNYKWLLFIWKTNSEYISELLPSFSNMTAHKSVSAGSWDSTNNAFAYNAWNQVAFSGTTNATVTSGYNNANFQMGIYEIWGIG